MMKMKGKLEDWSKKELIEEVQNLKEENDILDFEYEEVECKLYHQKRIFKRKLLEWSMKNLSTRGIIKEQDSLRIELSDSLHKEFGLRIKDVD